jgi:hypothetical protein
MAAVSILEATPNAVENELRVLDFQVRGSGRLGDGVLRFERHRDKLKRRDGGVEKV